MTRPLRTAALTGLAVLAATQFVRPAKNLGAANGTGEIGSRVAVPADVHRLLVDACYNCHSDHTTYPWYAEVEPVGWWLARHVNEGRAHLNFSRFAAYPPETGRPETRRRGRTGGQAGHADDVVHLAPSRGAADVGSAGPDRGLGAGGTRSVSTAVRRIRASPGREAAGGSF